MPTDNEWVYRVTNGEKIEDGAFSGCIGLTNITGWKRDGEIKWDLMKVMEDIKGKGKLED